jgi:hypothetical protein
LHETKNSPSVLDAYVRLLEERKRKTFQWGSLKEVLFLAIVLVIFFFMINQFFSEKVSREIIAFESTGYALFRSEPVYILYPGQKVRFEAFPSDGKFMWGIKPAPDFDECQKAPDAQILVRVEEP